MCFNKAFHLDVTDSGSPHLLDIDSTINYLLHKDLSKKKPTATYVD